MFGAMTFSLSPAVIPKMVIFSILITLFRGPNCKRFNAFAEISYRFVDLATSTLTNVIALVAVYSHSARMTE